MSYQELRWPCHGGSGLPPQFLARRAELRWHLVRGFVLRQFGSPCKEENGSWHANPQELPLARIRLQTGFWQVGILKGRPCAFRQRTWQVGLASGGHVRWQVGIGYLFRGDTNRTCPWRALAPWEEGDRQGAKSLHGVHPLDRRCSANSFGAST